MRVRTTIFWIVTLAVFATINWMIVQKETTLAHGRTVLLELAPVDPRSLMQGDYMRLRYAIAADRDVEALVGDEPTGLAVIALDERGVGRFVRFHAGEPLEPGEVLVRYFNNGSIRFGAESFFFQEGTDDRYQGAKYGELKVDDAGNSILVGLRDADLNPLGRTEAGAE